jgi:hypothetical protein
MLPLLAETLGTSIEELIGDEAKRSATRGPSPKIQQQLERVGQLPAHASAWSAKFSTRCCSGKHAERSAQRTSTAFAKQPRPALRALRVMGAG